MSARSRISSEMAPIVGLDSDADTLMTIFANMESSNCLIVTEGMHYAGIVSAASLIKVINEKQTEDCSGLRSADRPAQAIAPFMISLQNRRPRRR